MSIGPGSTIGSYQVGEVIGAGGMGEVYRATDTVLKRDVAIKVLPESFTSDADRLARFQREAEVLASLNHPNIAQIYGFENADGQTAIVMELIEGPTLADRISQGPMSPDEAISIGIQVAAALEVAHGRQIVHRDLKPANIKLKDDGTIRVLDFGIAKALEAEPISGNAQPQMTTPAMTQTGVILGTAAYMSPEQARGRFVDQRTDIWAFGCLLFEMLTGQPAFGGEDVMATLARVIDRDADINSIPGSISPSVRHTIGLCLRKDPKKRIADIRDVRLALEGDFEVALPNVAVGGAEGARTNMTVAAAGMLAAALVAGLLVWFVKPDPVLPVPMVTRYLHTLPEGSRLNQVTQQLIAVSPTGDRIAYGSDEALYVREAGEIEATILPQTSGQRPAHLAFSPDGEWIAYNSPVDRRIYKVAVRGGSPIPITAELSSSPRGITWTADDTLVYYGGQPGFVEITSSGGEPQPLAADGEGLEYRGSLLPGRSHLLFDRDGQIVIASLPTGEETLLFPGSAPHYLEAGYIIYFDERNLMARAFDAETLESGGPFALVDDVFRVQNDSAPQFDVSASGLLAYIRGTASGDSGGSVLALRDPDGTTTALDVPARRYAAPRVSPDGRHVAVQIDTDEGTDIHIYELNSNTELRQLTYDGSSDSPAWKDNETIVYSSEADGPRGIWEQNIGGGTARRLTTPDEGFVHLLPVFASDGRLVYAQLSGGTSTADVYVMSLPDGEPELLVGGENGQAGVSFSPDGNVMTYMSETGSTIESFVARYPRDGSMTRISTDNDVAMWPRFSRDRMQVTYVEARSRTLRAVDLTMPGLAAANRRDLGTISNNGNGGNFDSVPDSGQLLITWTPEAAISTQQLQIVVVENWLEEIKARVPPLTGR